MHQRKLFYHCSDIPIKLIQTSAVIPPSGAGSKVSDKVLVVVKLSMSTSLDNLTLVHDKNTVSSGSNRQLVRDENSFALGALERLLRISVAVWLSTLEGHHLKSAQVHQLVRAQQDCRCHARKSNRSLQWFRIAVGSWNFWLNLSYLALYSSDCSLKGRGGR